MKNEQKENWREGKLSIVNSSTRLQEFIFLMGQSRPLFVLFCPFHMTIQICEKRRCFARGSNSGPQVGRPRRIHRAMVDAQGCDEAIFLKHIVQPRPLFLLNL